MRALFAALALLAPLPAQAQAQTAEDVHAAERARFGYGELRPGALRRRAGACDKSQRGKRRGEPSGHRLSPSLFRKAPIPRGVRS